MCVRYTLHKADAALVAISKALGVLLDAPEWLRPRFNATLTDTMSVVALSASGPQLRAMRWGLVRAGEHASPRPLLLAKARAETAATLGSFRKSVAIRRCIVPANGFYEWETRGRTKLPHLFTMAGEEPFAFAGIWDPASDGLPETYCLLTTKPNTLVTRVHDRMPVLLTGGTMARWLGDRSLDEGEYRELTGPIAPGLMESRPVSRYVNSSRNEGPQCLALQEETPTEAEFDFG